MFSQQRKALYESEPDEKMSREERLNKLKTELRQHIRYLSDYPFLSADWIRMSESLHQIAHVAFMEKSMPFSETNPLEQHGKKSNGTLWDQEKEEMSIKIILEEGKLNLLLRVLHSFLLLSRTAEFDHKKQEAAAAFQCALSAIDARCSLFEESVGALLLYALHHVEAVQILDVCELLQMCSETMEHTLATTAASCAAPSEQKQCESKCLPSTAIVHATSDDSGADVAPAIACTATTTASNERLQSSLVIQYLQCIAQVFDQVDEDRLMDLIAQQNIISLSVKLVFTCRATFNAEVALAFAKFLNHCFLSDSFRSDECRFLSTDDIGKLLDMKNMFIDHFIENGTLSKSQARALIDSCAKWTRRHGESTASKECSLRMFGKDVIKSANPSHA